MRHNLLFFSGDSKLVDRLQTALTRDCTVLAVDPRATNEEALATRFVPNVIVVDAGCHTGARTALEHITSIRNRYPNLPLIALGDEMSAQLILVTFRAGADEFLDRDSSEGEIRAAVLSLLTDKVKEGGGSGVIVNILSPISSEEDGDLALNIASMVATSNEERRILLLDLSLPTTFTRAALGLEFNFKIPAALHDLARLDRSFLDSALARSPDTGLYVLPLADVGDEVALPDSRDLAVLLQILRTSFDVTVIHWGPFSQQAIQADLVNGHAFVGCNQRFTSVLSAKAFWAALCSSCQPVLAIHQFDSSMVPSPREVAEAVGAKQNIVLRADWSSLAMAHNRGRPIALMPPTHYCDALRTRLVQDGLLSGHGPRDATTKLLHWLNRARV
jgi:pilus assembly protein CpaE